MTFFLSLLGGFAYVFVAQDIESGTEYALKRLLGTDKDECDTIIAEIGFFKQLSGHPNIVQFVSASFINRTQSGQRLAEYLLVTELCKGGSLRDCLTDKPFEPDQVLRVFYQACKAVQHLHSQEPPINHRDIKIENFLLSSEGVLKLCDFGSATTKTFEPDFNWTAQQRDMLIDQVSENIGKT